MSYNVLGVNMSEKISILISALAFIVSFLCYIEYRKARISTGKACIIIDIIDIDNYLYIYMTNIGGTFVNDIKIQLSQGFVNGFENLNTIYPRSTYRYQLLNTEDICKYPEKIKVFLEYKDIYTPKGKIITAEFNLIDCMKMTIQYNSNLDCYDIEKTY